MYSVQRVCSTPCLAMGEQRRERERQRGSEREREKLVLEVREDCIVLAGPTLYKKMN